MRSATPGILLATCLTLTAVVAQESDPPPVDVGLEERVGINLVLLDFLIIDEQGRIVPDVPAERLRLQVDNRDVPILSLDQRCDRSVVAPPRPGDSSPAMPPGIEEPDRIVLVFDYDHIENLPETFERSLELLDRWPTGKENHMVVSMGEVVRIESPFTTDLDQLRWTFRRMVNDRDLYATARSRLTEKRFFNRLKALLDILERYPGRKTIVLFSGPFEPGELLYDPDYRELAALAAATRTAIYPVDTQGLRPPPTGLNEQAARIGTIPLGGPPELRRLANETGGRMTSDTNDISIAYAKAQYDLRCIYTLGFEDNRPKRDRERRLTLKVRKAKKLRVVYPDYYIVRSDKEKQRSLEKTATLAPHMFESDRLSAEWFVVSPEYDRWRATVAIELQLGEPADAERRGDWTVLGYLRKPNGTMIRRFENKLTVDEGARVAQGWESMTANPGDYVLSVVATHRDGGEPVAATRSVRLSSVPQEGSYMLGPYLGRRSGDGKATAFRKGQPVFRPLLRPVARAVEPLDTLTIFCAAGARARGNGHETLGRVLAADGSEVLSLGARDAGISRGSDTECSERVDRLSLEALAPGDYELSASSRSLGFETATVSLEFTLTDAPLESGASTESGAP